MSKVTMTAEQMQTRIAELEAQNVELQANAKKPVGRPAKTQNGLKITDKGALSFYHGTRFPITLYRDGWEKVLSKCDEIRDFLAANVAQLPSKEEAKAKENTTVNTENVAA